MLRRWARLGGVPVVSDLVLSLYETLIDDRALVSRTGLAVRLP